MSRFLSQLSKGDRRLVASGLVATAASAGVYYGKAGQVVPFIVTGVALGTLAALVGRAVDRLGDSLGSGATGVVQSALGNLPELFIGIFALRAGLVTVVEAALVGSILANLLLVLGAAFIVGGLRHGTQHFTAEAARLSLLLLVAAIAVIMVPTLSAHLGIGASQHERALSDVASVVLLVIFGLSIPSSLRSGKADPKNSPKVGASWSVALVVIVLLGASVAAAVVSDWFVNALSPALVHLHISQAFAGFVIVAIAGNAVENFVGIRLAFQNRSDYALSVILQSPVQIAVGLIPLLVLLSNVLGGATLTLVLPTLLIAALGLAAIVSIVVVFDGESTWLEGVTLVGLYIVIAAAFWWG